MRPSFEKLVETDETALAALEERFGFEFPVGYRSFLLGGETGRPSPQSWGEDESEVDVDRFLSVSELAGYAEREHTEAGWLLFARISFGDYFALRVRDGSVFQYEHEYEGDDVDGAFREVAGTFEEFLEAFHEPYD